ncbi:MAG: type II toxin-antitoxin system RelE/ParE family toxin [Nitrospirae bacterium]|nr:type II toxin-antitoxin system RelE/ParE family toxin [Nitrospirota bacterium]
MKWSIEYSKRAVEFIKEHSIEDGIRGSIIVKLKGQWADYFRIRRGKIRIILKPDTKTETIFVDAIDFRGKVYK